jgi:hypothetical protein
MTELQDKANDAFYAWEIANNEQDLSDRDRMIWTAGWIEAQLQKEKENEIE